MKARRTAYLSLAAAAVLTAGSALAHTAPYTTPPGLTLVDVSKLMDAGAPQFLWRRLGDENGKPLYTSDADQAGVANCYDACAKEFTPLIASAGAKASGDWTLVVRRDGAKQWAYQTKPLYRYAGKDPLGEPQGARFQLKEDPAWYDPGSDVHSPKTGWRRAAYTPEKSASMPAIVGLAALPAAGGVGFVDPATRMTIYAVPGSRKLSRNWQPVAAATLALPVGDFSIITRKDDRTRQWAYQGEPLYTFAGDYAPGEANGLTAGEKGAHAALAFRDFMPPGIVFQQYPGRGTLMTTAKGMALYTVQRFHATYGGLEAPGGSVVSYNEIKSQGSIGCEGDCTETWTPMIAPANAAASGFWELVTRANGSRQWAFKGSPVYAYVGDKKPGQIEGSNRYVVVYGGPNGEMTYADAGNDPRSLKHKIGAIDMAAAAGMKPGETPLYVAGDGFVPAKAEGGRAALNAAGSNANAANGANNAGNNGNDRPPSHGAGFYWRAVQLFGLNSYAE